MRPGLNAEAEFMEIPELGVFLGIVHPLPEDPDPKRTQLNQMQKVYRLVASGRIPSIKMGSRLFFEKAAVVAAMRSGAHQSCVTSQAVPAHVLRSLNPK